MPADPVSAQQRLKAILTEDRQDTPAPGSQIREGFQVVASVTYPHDESPVTLPKAVETMLAQHFGTVTAAKKAIRRKEILVAGKVCDTSRLVNSHNLLQLPANNFPSMSKMLSGYFVSTCQQQRTPSVTLFSSPMHTFSRRLLW